MRFVGRSKADYITAGQISFVWFETTIIKCFKIYVHFFKGGRGATTKIDMFYVCLA